MKIFLYIIGALLVLFIAAATWAYYTFPLLPPLAIEKDATDQEKSVVIDVWFQKLRAQQKFNGAVLIAKDGQPILSKGYGYSDLGRTRKNNEHTSFRLASLSKQFTATGVMLLHEKGAIDYDDRVVKYLKNFPYRDVTIRHLLNQTSGIPDVYLALADQRVSDIKVLSNQRAVELIKEEKPSLDNEPGAHHQYSNTDYILAARLIEVVSGQSFEAYMNQHLFEPLGMQDSRIWNLLSAPEENTNRAEDLEITETGTVKLEPSFIDGVAGDGAVFSSVNDLLLWDQFWYNDQLMPQNSKMKAFEKPILSNGKKSDYGFGWYITKDGTWHNGAWMGARTDITRNIKAKTCAVIIDNSSSIYIDDIAVTLNDALNASQ